MRVGFDATVLDGDTRRTGTGRYASSLLRELSRLSLHEADLEIVAFSREEPAAELAGGLTRWRRLPGRRPAKLQGGLGHLIDLPRLVKEERIDVFHTPTVHTRPSLPPVPARLGRPLVVTLHDVIPLSLPEGKANMPLRMRLFYDWNLRRALRAEALITVSRFAKDEIVRHTGIDAGRVEVVHNGVDDLEVPGGAATGDESPYLLYVGSLEPRKNVARLVKAFDLAARRGMEGHLVLVCDLRSGHAGSLQDEVASLASKGRIRFVTAADDRMLADLYVKARAFVFPSLAEGFGLPPLEAMALGTPVIAARAASLPEVLGEAALYAEPTSIESLAEAMLRMSGEKDLQRRLSDLGRRRAQGFTWCKAASETLAVYRKVLAQ